MTEIEKRLRALRRSFNLAFPDVPHDVYISKDLFLDLCDNFYTPPTGNNTFEGRPLIVLEDKKDIAVIVPSEWAKTYREQVYESR